jgi:hypothetical protein
MSVFSMVSDLFLALPIEEATRTYNFASITELLMAKNTVNNDVKNCSVSNTLYGRVGIVDLFIR